MRSVLVLSAALAAACGRDAPRPAPAADTVTAKVADSPARDCGTPLIGEDGVGAIRLGMPADSIKAHCTVVRDTVQQGSEGESERVVVVAFARDTVTVEIDSARAWRIEITSPGPRTTDSVGVGTPLRRLLALRSPRGLTGEGNLFVMSPAHCGLSFQLSEPRSPAGEWPAQRLHTLPASTVVTRILVVGCRDR